MDVDPVASVRIWSVDLDLGGETFEIPALPAADWVPILMSGRLLDVLDLVDDPDRVDRVMVRGDIEPDQIRDAIRSVVEQVSGRDAHTAMVIVQSAALRWEVIGGDLVRSGVRFDQIPLGAALDAIHASIMAHLKPEDREKFQSALRPPEQGDQPSHSERKRAESQFTEMAGPKPDPAPVPAQANDAPSANVRPKTRQQLERHRRDDQ